jgi:hypothetical protein
MLPMRVRRYRSSTSASNLQTSKAADVLRGLLGTLAQAAASCPAGAYPQIDHLLDQLRQIHQHVDALPPPSQSQDDFRHLHGFQTLLNVLRSFSGFYSLRKRSGAEKESIFDLVHMVLATLSAAFRGHPGNRRYFQDIVEGGGWDALEQIIASIGVGGGDSDLWTDCQLFGKLLSFALDDQRLDELCRSVAPCATPSTSTTRAGELQEPDASHNDEGSAAYSVDSVEARLEEIIGPTTVIQNAEIVRAVVAFWESISRGQSDQTSLASVIVLTTLSSVASASLFNLSALHGTGMLSRLLRLLFAEDSVLTKFEREKALTLCKSLMYLGLDHLADAQFLLRRQDAATSEFCLEMTEKYTGPPFIQFDLSLYGHASLELPNLGRSFPPQAAPGYTFTAWIRIDRFDPQAHTTLFGVFDSTQTCFLLAYLEKDTRNFILQTSITSPRPSVRFKSVAFREDQWYHIALVHRRPKTMVASKASLYVNGEFAEQIRAAYPSPPPVSGAGTESFVSFASSSGRTNPVQAFLGTPRGLAAQLGPGLVQSKWSLASAHLFEDVLSDDLLAVYYRLGPRYQGNFQDCLGGFQTYEASAALGLRNEVFHPGKDENSDILKAIRDKASTILPEHKVLLSAFSRAVFSADGKFMDSLLFRSLSKDSASSLFLATTKTGTAVSINGAVPCINDALIRSNGVSILAGDPVVITPYHFDDNLWRLGGFTPVGLKLVERSSTSEELLRSVELMFHCISNSWRNSEAMERDNGYAILCMLLRAKLGYGSSAPDSQSQSWRLALTNDARDRLSFQLLSLVLHFVGYNHADPIESFIVNPLAYRILLIDADTWRRSSPLAQELYYKQFVTFAVKSKHHQFNGRRLLRMRKLSLVRWSTFAIGSLLSLAGIIKRLLDALKAETISENIMPHFMASFESLVKCNYNAEVHRSIALFITYAFHTPPGPVSRTPKPASAGSRSGTPGLGVLRRPTVDMSSSSAAPASKMLSKKQLGVRILEMYTRLLCDKTNLTDIRKFAKTVTNKVIYADGPKKKQKEYVLTTGQWLLYLLAENDPEIVVYGCKILARLLVTQPPSYAAKFATKTGGFWIMAYRLKQWWDISTLWPILFSILFGYDVANIDFDKSFDFFSLLELFGTSRIVFPDVLSVITSMIQHGLRDILKYQDDPDSPAGDPATTKSSVEGLGVAQTRPRARSMELGQALEPRSRIQPSMRLSFANP